MDALRTIDVWDTLLRRDCHPECIKLATAIHTSLLLARELQRTFTPLALYRQRLAIEDQLARDAQARGLDGEYALKEVLRALLAAVLDAPVQTCLIEQIARFELATEMRRSSADAGIIDFLEQYPADKTLFLSDFYMDKAFLRELLAAKGLAHIAGDGLSSCDIGLNKRSGRLFQHLHAELGVAPGSHVHVGDNPWSDVESPRSLGIRAVWYLPQEAHAARLAHEQLFESRGHLFTHIASTAWEQTGACPANRNPEEHRAFLLGVRSAPLFASFALWSAERAVAARSDLIGFLSREGEFLLRVHEAMFPDGELHGHRLPQASALSVSRLSTFAASLTDFSARDVKRMWSLTGHISLAGLYASLGLDISDFSDELSRRGWDRNTVLSAPDENASLADLIECEPMQSAMRRQAAQQRDLLARYCRAQGLQDATCVSVVDVGWRGTIQDNLARVFPAAQFEGSYLGLRRFANVQPPNCRKAAYGPDEQTSLEHARLFEAFAGIELLCSAASGSVLAYAGEAGNVVVVRDAETAELDVHGAFARHFQDGVVAATAVWRDHLVRYAVSAAEVRALAMQCWQDIAAKPDAALSTHFLDSPQHDAFASAQAVFRVDPPSMSAILLALFSRQRRRALISFVARVQWTSTLSHLSDVSAAHRYLLIALFRAAHGYRWLRARFRAR